MNAEIEPHIVRKGSGIPLLAIHGNGVDHRLLFALDNDLSRANIWERIYFDLPGYGQTSSLPAPGGLPEMAAWLEKTVKKLVGDQPFALLANSLGGLLARHIVATYTDQIIGLALIAPVVDPDSRKRHLPEKAVTEVVPGFLDSVAEADCQDFVDVTVRQTPDAWEAFSTHALPGIRRANPEAMTQLSRRYFLKETPERANFSADFPTLIIAGRQDHIVGFHDQFSLLAYYSRATYLVIDDAGHNVHLEQPELVSAALSHWSENVRRYLSVRSIEMP